MVMRMPPAPDRGIETFSVERLGPRPAAGGDDVGTRTGAVKALGTRRPAFRTSACAGGPSCVDATAARGDTMAGGLAVAGVVVADGEEEEAEEAVRRTDRLCVAGGAGGGGETINADVGADLLDAAVVLAMGPPTRCVDVALATGAAAVADVIEEVRKEAERGATAPLLVKGCAPRARKNASRFSLSAAAVVSVMGAGGPTIRSASLGILEAAAPGTTGS